MPIILDHIEGYSYDPAALPTENLHALEYLPAGMHYLAQAVRSREKYETGRGPRFEWSGDLNDGVVNSMFNWFSVSCISYAGLVAAIRLIEENRWDLRDLRKSGVQKSLRNEKIAYASKVIPEILMWRNKVGAHPAFSDPKGAEEEAMLASSVMGMVTFRLDRIYIGNKSKHGGFALAGVESPLSGWSLTDEFERLAPRWWPDRKLPNFRASPTRIRIIAKQMCTGCGECKLSNFGQPGTESCVKCGCSWRRHLCLRPNGEQAEHENANTECEWFFSVRAWVHREYTSARN